MKDSWPLRTIADCASQEPYATQIGPFGKALTPDEYTPSGVPLLRGVNVNQGRFHDDDFVFISEETADRMWKYESFPGDVLFVHKGTLGKIGLMPKSRRFNRYIMGNSMLRVRCDHSKLLPEYLYYWLCSADGQHYILSRVSQVGVPQIQRPLATLREAKLPIPPVGYQKAVVDVLGTLDDKIELNRRMNETLEGMARAIFKSWFVDFDPVRAKADGRARQDAARSGRPRKPRGVASDSPRPGAEAGAGVEGQPAGMDPATAALFPDSFEDSPLGKIPKGWKAGAFGEVAESPRRTIDPKSCAPETPYIGLEHMPRRNITLAEWGLSGNVTSGKAAFSRGEILFGKLRPYFHKVGVALVDGVCSTDILTIVPLLPEFRGFVLYHASSTEIIDYADAVSTGTKMPRVSWNDLARFEIPIPSRETAGKFTQNVEPMLDRLRTNVLEIRSLAALRDALLPKLLSGEIRVPEAEKLIDKSTTNAQMEAAHG